MKSISEILVRIGSAAAILTVAGGLSLAQTGTTPKEGATMDRPQPPNASGAPSSGSMDNPASGGAAAIIPTESTSNILAKEELIGDLVVTKDGDDIGTVEDVILDPDGKIKGIVVSTGGFLGLGGKKVGISSDAVNVRTAKRENAVQVNLSKSEFDQVSATSEGSKM